MSFVAGEHEEDAEKHVEGTRLSRQVKHRNRPTTEQEGRCLETPVWLLLVQMDKKHFSTLSTAAHVHKIMRPEPKL